MKSNFNVAIVLCSVFFIAITALPSHAKLSSPPSQLTSVFADIAEFETAFKSEKWEEALGSTGKINTKFNQMIPQLKKEIKGNTENFFREIMGKLEQSVKKRDQEKTEKNFIELHKYILTLIGNYEYKIPPIFIIINKYIGEAEEALEQKHYSRVLSEIEEISFLFSFAENHLDDRDTRLKQIAAIKTKLQEIKAAAQFKKNEAAKIGIKSLKKMMSDLIKLT
jgi:hypothetical protein